jgi:hypothetical protein
MIEAKSREVMNTFTEREFQDAYKKWQKQWERCIRAEEGYFEGVVTVGPKLVLGQMAAPVPEIIDGSLYNKLIFYFSPIYDLLYK